MWFIIEVIMLLITNYMPMACSRGMPTSMLKHHRHTRLNKSRLCIFPLSSERLCSWLTIALNFKVHPREAWCVSGADWDGSAVHHITHLLSPCFRFLYQLWHFTFILTSLKSTACLFLPLCVISNDIISELSQDVC